MSGRIRTIKPEVLDDELAASLSDEAWRMWVSLWVLADDFGNVRLGAKYLSANVWQDTSRDPTAGLTELVSKGFLAPYAVNSQRYGAIRSWAKHQRVDNAGKSRVPGPNEEDGTWDQALGANLAAENAMPISSLPTSRLRTRALSPTTTTTPTPTPTPRDEPDRDPPERRFSTGTSGFAAKAAYETAMAKATGRPFGFPARAVGDLCELLNKHAVTEPSRDAALEWLERSLAEWVSKADPKFTSGWSPMRLNAWLNEGRPGANERREPVREPDSQPLTHAQLVARGML